MYHDAALDEVQSTTFVVKKIRQRIKIVKLNLDSSSAMHDTGLGWGHVGRVIRPSCGKLNVTCNLK